MHKRTDRHMINARISGSMLMVIGLISITALTNIDDAGAQCNSTEPINILSLNGSNEYIFMDKNEQEMPQLEIYSADNSTEILNTTRENNSSGTQQSAISAKPSHVPSPVIGILEQVGKTNTCFGKKWCFWQRQGEGHAGKVGIGAADDTYAWDINLNSPAFDTDKGQPVYAVATGKVAQTYGGKPNADDPNATFGQVLIEHSYQGSKWWSGYLHMGNIQVKRGQDVTTGTVIGYISNKKVPDKNNHLHFVVYTGANSYGNLISFNATIKPRYEYYGIDFNADGKADLIDTTGGYVKTFLSNGDGSYSARAFTPWIGYNTAAGVWGSGDINGDDKRDLLHMPGGEFINILLSRGDGTFNVKPFRPWPGYATYIGKWYTADANGDSRTDLIHIIGWNFIYTFTSNGDGTFSIKLFTPWSNYNTAAGIWIMGDINGDDMTDPLHLTSDSINSWISKGDGTYRIKTFKPWSGYNMGIGRWGLGDVNGDGKTEIIHVAGDSANTWISKGDGTYSIKAFKLWPGYNTGAGEWYSTDVSGDGKTDLMHIVGDTANTWISKGDGTYNYKPFNPWPGYNTASGSWCIGDENADGKTDLEHIVSKNLVYTWVSKGDGTFIIKSFQPPVQYYASVDNQAMSFNNSSISALENESVRGNSSTFIEGYGMTALTNFIDGRELELRD